MTDQVGKMVFAPSSDASVAEVISKQDLEQLENEIKKIVKTLRLIFICIDELNTGPDHSAFVHELLCEVSQHLAEIRWDAYYI